MTKARIEQISTIVTTAGLVIGGIWALFLWYFDNYIERSQHFNFTSELDFKNYNLPLPPNANYCTAFLQVSLNNNSNSDIIINDIIIKVFPTSFPDQVLNTQTLNLDQVRKSNPIFSLLKEEYNFLLQKYAPNTGASYGFPIMIKRPASPLLHVYGTIASNNKDLDGKLFSSRLGSPPQNCM